MDLSTAIPGTRIGNAHSSTNPEDVHSYEQRIYAEERIGCYSTDGKPKTTAELGYSPRPRSR